MNKAIKYRILPNKEQIVLFHMNFGCSRKIWNLMLEDRQKAYETDGRTFLPRPAMYKDEYEYLKEADSMALCNVQLQLEKAFRDFFRNKEFGHPKFKSKKGDKASYTTNNVTLDAESGTIKLPKIKTPVRIKLHRQPPKEWKLKSATISEEPDGKFYCALLFEYEQDIKPITNPHLNAGGLDYKSDGLFATSDGEICGSPKYFRQAQERLAKMQRKLRLKKKGSKNYQKLCRAIAKEHRRIANQRKDFLHKKALEIANRYDLVCVEDLNMRALSNKGFGNGKATMDNGYGMFLTFLEYKLAERGKLLIRIDKWYPSSQLCSECGNRQPEMKDTKIDTFICTECGSIIHRDINAAINIKNEGVRLFLEQ